MTNSIKIIIEVMLVGIFIVSVNTNILLFFFYLQCGIKLVISLNNY